jgi:hypothetical protein
VSSERPGIAHLQVGDEVLFQSASGGEWWPAVIVEQKRVWWLLEVTREVAGHEISRAVRMRADTQTDGSRFPHRFATPEQRAWDRRRVEADRYLTSVGVDVRHSARWRNDRVTLANLIRAHEGLEEL